MANKGLHTYTVQEGTNAGLGQGGSMMISTTGTDFAPPTGQVFVAFTVIGTVAATFESLTADREGLDGHKFICDNTADAGNPVATPTVDSIRTGPPGDLVDAQDFPLGITIYGRWTKINLSAGMIVAYLGS